ncbi:porin [Thiomonas delicata]|uniref:Porin Gram-negative type n=1 Tax=Thiomonas delicata TaxID=364030 RepID=A0A238D2D0_THIDL|nr:porin [Thiomonas delicata]SBP87344.1 Porin Gram-negative type [Thiomonas delicata]
MKKSLLALAVFGAFSGAAFAQSNVQLYGIIDVGVTHYTGLKPAGTPAAGQTTSSTGLSSGVQSASRIGVKGTEDLGGGLNAFFDAETGFCAAGTNQDGTTTQTAGNQTYCTGGGFMQRQAFVGLAGNFGTLSLGRQYTPPFTNEANMDPFGFGLTGDIANLSLVGRYGLYRANQAAAYVTPDMGGFKGTVAYSFAPGNAGTVPTASGPGSNVSRAISLNGQYGNGPITAGLNYTQVTNVYQNPTTFVNDGKLKGWQLYGAYDFGVAKVSGIYEDAKQDYYSGDQKFWMLGATVPVGPGAILVSYSQLKNSLVAQGSTAPEAGTAKQYALGYTYSLSKRTNLYTSYAHISNDVGTAFAVGSSTDSFAGVLGQGSSGFALGIRHQF